MDHCMDAHMDHEKNHKRLVPSLVAPFLEK